MNIIIATVFKTFYLLPAMKSVRKIAFRNSQWPYTETIY